MAQEVKIILIDDLDGEHADETVTFGMDGKDYEIDLSEEHAEEFRSFVRRYIGHGRKLAANRQGHSKSLHKAATKSSGSKPDPELAAIRAWAQENGYKVGDKGRVAQHIKDAYYTSMQTTAGV